VTRTWIQQRDQASASRGNLPESIRTYMVDVLRASRENGYRIPPSLLALYRALLGAESLAIELHSPHDIASIGRRFFQEMQIEQAMSAFQFNNVLQSALPLIDLLKNMPARLDHLLDMLANDSFVVRVRQSESAHAREQANIRARLVSASILVVAIAVLFAGAGVYKTSLGVGIRWILAGTGLVIAGRVALLWRALR